MAVLKVENVSKSFDGEKILEQVSIQLNKGEIVSVLGISGSGKTTLFNVIAGLTSVDEGTITLDGEEITGQTGKVSYMLQKDLLLPYRTIIDNVALPLLIKGMKKKEAREIVGRFFEQFGLNGTQKKYPSQISGGMRQRAAFLRTYLFSEKVALLDEPFSALDMLTKKDMHIWYLEMMKEIKLSTLFITHDIDEAIYLSDRIYLLTGKPGRILKELKIERQEKDRNEFLLSEQFLEYKREILAYLEKRK